MTENRGYENPHALVSTDWVADNLDNPAVRLVESNEDPLVYSTGHIPGAVEIDWTRDLNQPVIRDFIQSAECESLLRRHGIREDDTLVFYGDKNNWWASYAFYIFSMFGIRNMKIMEGGRLKWMSEGRPLSRDLPSFPISSIKVKERNDTAFRVGRDQMLRSIEKKRRIIDVRSRQEFMGESLHMPGYISDGALRAGRIPGAQHLHWQECVHGEFAEYKSAEELRAMCDDMGIHPNHELILYCRIGKRSSHNWFVLTQLLGFKDVRTYDAGWLEWGNLMDVPIER